MTELQQLFERLYRAKRETALATDRVRRLERDLEVARTDLEQAQEVEQDSQARLDRLAAEAAGVRPEPPAAAERPLGYVPVR